MNSILDLQCVCKSCPSMLDMLCSTGMARCKYGLTQATEHAALLQSQHVIYQTSLHMSVTMSYTSAVRQQSLFFYKQV